MINKKEGISITILLFLNTNTISRVHFSLWP